MNSKIDCMFEKIIAEATKEMQDALNITAESLVLSENMRLELANENNELKNTIAKYELVSEVEPLFTEDNFEGMLPFFKLKSNDFRMNGMDANEVPKWFLHLFHYYEDRDRLFKLMDLFGVKYPSWARQYKMPYEYSEDELSSFVAPGYDRYITNGCIFSDNIGFFWRNIKRCHGNTNKILTDTYTFEDAIPWQLILSNPLWKKDEMFVKILEAIKRNSFNHSEYFFAIQDYIDISVEQILELIKLLPTERIFYEHKKFIKINEKLIKGNSFFAEKYRNNISSDSYSPFYYLNYPVGHQMNFIRSMDDFEVKMKLINRMEISKDEKIKFSMEFLDD